MRGSNEPDTSNRRKDALDHFLREIDGFLDDYESEVGPEWDDKIRGFRLGLESILGNGSGSVMVRGEAGDKNHTGQDNFKRTGDFDSIAGLSVNNG
jgi:SMODS and SLOG-associating 2TM effector domain